MVEQFLKFYEANWESNFHSSKKAIAIGKVNIKKSKNSCYCINFPIAKLKKQTQNTLWDIKLVKKFHNYSSCFHKLQDFSMNFKQPITYLFQSKFAFSKNNGSKIEFQNRKRPKPEIAKNK